MSTFQLHRALDLATTVGDAWDFISSPENLGRITPDYMNFEIRTQGLPHKIYPGLIIEYRVSPLKGIRMPWLTEITHLSEQQYFVDEQRRGPYALWHHEHWLEPVSNGVRMKDLLTYRLPAGPLGGLAHRLFVRKKLEDIFKYREEAMIQIFGRA